MAGQTPLTYSTCETGLSGVFGLFACCSIFQLHHSLSLGACLLVDLWPCYPNQQGITWQTYSFETPSIIIGLQLFYPPVLSGMNLPFLCCCLQPTRGEDIAFTPLTLKEFSSQHLIEAAGKVGAFCCTQFTTAASRHHTSRPSFLPNCSLRFAHFFLVISVFPTKCAWAKG